MKTKIHTSYALLIIVIAGLSSCMSQYPKYTGHYHPKINNSSVAASKQQPVEKRTNDIKPLQQSGSYALVTPQDMKPEINASQLNTISSPLRKTRNHKALLNVSDNSQKAVSGKIGIYSFAVQKITADNAYYDHDGSSNHLLVRGLIFLIVGLLLQGLWAVAGPIGILIAIVGIVCIIYGLILILESI